MKPWMNSCVVTLSKLRLKHKKWMKHWRHHHFSRHLRMETLEDRQLLTTFTVNTTLDEDNGINVGGVSLREAVVEAVSGDTINFSTNSSHGLNGATITLHLTKGQIVINGESLTIDASMLPDGITIDANDPSPDPYNGIRIFNITDPTGGVSPPLVTLIGLTLTGGDVAGDGGAIRSAARLVLQDCDIRNNQALSSGGGVHVSVNGSFSIAVRDSLFFQNSASSGGGLFVQVSNGAALAVERSTFQENDSGRGGGLYVNASAATVEIDGSMFEENEATAYTKT
jgi:hypothetical protein